MSWPLLDIITTYFPFGTVPLLGMVVVAAHDDDATTPTCTALVCSFEMELRLRKSCWGAITGMNSLKRDIGW